MFDFTLPSLGADMDEGTLTDWLVKPGDEVERGQAIATVDTVKAAVDVEIWQSGTVHRLLVEPGTTVSVGTPLATLLNPGESPPPERPTADGVPGTTAATPAGEPAPRRKVSPRARKEAERAGIDLAGVTGTGADAAVTLDDVQRAAAHGIEHGPAEAKTRDMRSAIAASMSRSKRDIPHYYLMDEIPLRTATKWLRTENAARPITERVLLAAVQLKAVALAAQQFPDLNGYWVDGEFRPAPHIHLGVAISLRDGGLVAPAIHDTADKPLSQLMVELGDLVTRARAGSLRSSEMSDPTLTVTNLGERGVTSVFGVIYPPQVALVGFGRPSERPWVFDGDLQVATVVTATLAADHRASDGTRGAQFLTRISELLQQPDRW
ncbi:MULTISPECIES: dihydrolipoamide acetyltransferase family protein [unclassified Rhodococcus (in: high G+C Gram-positive bacteria)]|uniref:dihydrolipoamide acetyltransferase family protein n=1 Tax=unclassified Rhodococcus (in: high G+C Gram-positive bacteria) TaxID=192944 RepID=UPI00077A704B|nr:MULTISPECIES: dihydrolipoamide acetyltransferase family protein [unclassified Rhodococcus (in: high G+C Gram-positive bacteria)]KXX58855.1 branched-chain alpha-keto acid dehydrogenase subunit E2 [Rhodococcus sp. LB1]PBC45526.1 branched-chain alpha-keto acid dehydrogenase subunit E2 [Rhodococcus sp. ACPA1]